MQKTLIPASLVLLVAILAIAFYATKLTKPIEPNKVVVLAPAYVDGSKTYGVIRTTGLNSIDGEKDRLMLKLSDFQLTDLNPSTSSYLGHTYYGFFIEDSDFDYASLLGVCVETEIQHLVAEEATASIASAYDRFPAKVLSLSSVPREKCSVYSPNSAKSVGEELTLTGILQRFDRPSPDIAYDYILELAEPYLDEENASGTTQSVSKYVLIPATDAVWSDFEDNIAKDVSITGSFEWGFAESKFFSAKKLETE